MKFPDLIVIGAAKAGTSAFYRYIEQHPQIYTSSIKEPQFFGLEGETKQFKGPPGMEIKENKAIRTMEEYQALFKDAPEDRCIVEASTSYLYLPKASERIHHYIPQIKLIAILRNPVERAYSAFLYLTRASREPITDFSKALLAEPTRIQNDWAFLYRYQDFGFYSSQLKRYYDKFDSAQLRIFLHDDLKADPLKVMRETFSFLNLDSTFEPDMSRRFNVSGLPKNKLLHKLIGEQNMLKSALKSVLPRKYRSDLKERYYEKNLSKPRLAEETRLQLIETFREDILKTQDLIGRDLSAWLK